MRHDAALHRAREELHRRAEAEAGKEAAATNTSKKDWSLALRYRLTAEMRAEIAARISAVSR